MFRHFSGARPFRGAPRSGLGAVMLAAGLTLAAMGALFGWPKPGQAAGTVGNGTPLSCNESSLSQAISTGGPITFNCGPFPVEIALSSQKTLVTNTSIDGGGLVFLSGNNATRLFNVPAGMTFDLVNLTIYKGFANGDSGGAIYAGGAVRLANTSIVSSSASIVGGAVYVAPTGSFQMNGGSLSANTAISNGGALYQDGGTATIRNTSIISNAGDSGGALYNQSGTLSVEASTVFSNVSNATGGAIVSISSLNVASTVFQTNSSRSSSGGAVTAAGVFTITSSRFLTNTAGSDVTQSRGGGLRVTNSTQSPLGGAVGSVTDTSFISNTSVVNGGGMSVESGTTVRVARSTFAFNKVTGATATGGGLDVLGSAYIVNSTFYGNFAAYGGGISTGYGGVSSVLSITHATIVTNTALNGGGGVYEGGGDLRFRASVATANFPVDCRTDAGSQGSDGSNWITSPGNCTFAGFLDLPNLGSPNIGALRDNGGPTLTEVPNAGSPLLDKVVTSGCPGTDQRGIPRPQGVACDIGAIEYGAVPVLSSVTGVQSLLVTTVTLTAGGSNFVYGDTIRLNGIDLPTTFVNYNTLVVTTTAASLPASGVVSVTVFNPGTDGGPSNGISFNLNRFVLVPMVVSNYGGGW